MSRHELDLRLDAPAPDGLASAFSDESDRLRTGIYRELGLKVHSKAWVRIDLSSERGTSTVLRLLEACRTGRVVAGSGTFSEHLDESESRSADWSYLITRTANDSFSLWDDYPSYKTSEVAAENAMNHTFVSESFVEFYERSALRGLSFLRCRRRGRKSGRAWFVALADHSLGHGLDHPWFDRRRWIQDVGDDRAKRSSSLDMGQSNFHLRWSKMDRMKGVPGLKPLLDLFAMTPAHESTLIGLCFVTIPRFWTVAFPDTDFAYVPWGEDGPTREGKVLRFRRLMVGQKARRALIAGGLFSERAFLGVRSVASPEEGVDRLDERYPPVPPMFTSEELADLRAREKNLFAV